MKVISKNQLLTTVPSFKGLLYFFFLQQYKSKWRIKKTILRKVQVSEDGPTWDMFPWGMTFNGLTKETKSS